MHETRHDTSFANLPEGGGRTTAYVAGRTYKRFNKGRNGFRRTNVPKCSGRTATNVPSLVGK